MPVRRRCRVGLACGDASGSLGSQRKRPGYMPQGDVNATCIGSRSKRPSLRVLATVSSDVATKFTVASPRGRLDGGGSRVLLQLVLPRVNQ